MTSASKNSAVNIRRITLIGFSGNLFLSAIKFVLGWVGSSQALIADAVHSLSDISTDMAILFGSYYWSAPADDSHPYGHGRIEALIAAFIGFVLLGVALGIGYHAVLSVQDNQHQSPKIIAFWGAVISIILKEILYHWTLFVGKKESSSALIANAWHHRTDALSSIPVAAAVIIAAFYPQWAFIDSIGAAIVSIFILQASYKILKSAFEELADGGGPEDLKCKIK